MADWSLPTLSSLYTDFLTFMSNRLNDVATMFNSAPSNQPANSIRFNRTGGVGQFEQWDGISTWTAQQVSITGGGTGANTASGARTALGLGTMSTQNANAVAITGGSVASSALSGLVPQSNLGTGSGGLGTKFLADDQTYKTVPIALTCLIKTANYTVTNADLTAHTLLICTTNAFTVSLPSVSANDGLQISIKSPQTVNSITVNPNGAEKIDGASSITIPPGVNGAYFSYTLVACNARSEWVII